MNGRSCQTIHILSQAMPSYDRTEQCAGLRSANQTASQACPQACNTCTGADSSSLESAAPAPSPADTDDVELPSDLSTSPSSTPSMELPADQLIVLRTPLGTHLPVETTRWNLSGGASFGTIDITTLGTFWAAQQLETVLYIPPAGEASLLLPSDAFAASPGVFRTHVFVNFPRSIDSVAEMHDVIELQLLPYNSTNSVSGAVLDTLHLSETTSQLLDSSHDGADLMLAGEWREMQSQFQLVPEQLPGRLLIKLYGSNIRAFGGVRC
jgi:hypothetical protein